MVKNAIVLCFGFLFIVFPLFSEGMFMDGTIYAAVADNLAEGNGSLWHMEFSKTLMSDFHEHPPLAIWMESVYHLVFDGSLLSERLYSLTMWIINAFLIVELWKTLKQPKELTWFPLLLWVIIPEIHWAFSNNVLENTMGVFVSASVLFYLKSLNKNRWVYVFLFSLMIFFSLLTKGFTGSYVMALPLLIGMFWRKDFILKTLQDTILGLLIVSVLLLILWYGWEGAASNLTDYLTMQVAGSIENVETVFFRGQILLEFLNGLIAPIILVLILVILTRKKGLTFVDTSKSKESLVLFFICLAGVLPIMISMKQRSFYILTVFPFSVISLAMYFTPSIIMFNNWLSKYVFRKSFLVVGILSCIISLMVSSTYMGRDKEMLIDVNSLSRILGEGKEIELSDLVEPNWAIIAYLARYNKQSVTFVNDNWQFLLRLKTEPDLKSNKEIPLIRHVLEIRN